MLGAALLGEEGRARLDVPAAAACPRGQLVGHPLPEGLALLMPRDRVQPVLQHLKKYAVFSGRATRSEYWWFVLCEILILGIASLISDIASQVEHILAAEFRRRRLDPKTAPLYAQMLVGMVAIPGGWWLDSRRMKKEDVAAHLVNLAWNGLSGMEARPALRTVRDRRE